jgi:transposase
MSTSLLYHAFGLRGYVYQRARYVGGATEFVVKQPSEGLRCSACKSRKVIRRGQRERRFRGLPIGSRPVWIVLPVPRLECKACGLVRQAEVPFAEGQHGYTKRFARLVVELAQSMTMVDVAKHLDVSWNLVKEIVKAALKQRFRKPDLKGLRLLAIDEIAIGGGHRYLTVVLDLESGAVVFLGEGRSAEALEPFWKRLKRARAQIEAVAIDMSQAYISAVRAHLPRATLVFDHFHVVKLMNDKLADLRRELQREADEARKDVLKGTRWLLLKDPGKLDEKRDEAARLKAALDRPSLMSRRSTLFLSTCRAVGGHTDPSQPEEDPLVGSRSDPAPLPPGPALPASASREHDAAPYRPGTPRDLPRPG